MQPAVRCLSKPELRLRRDALVVVYLGEPRERVEVVPFKVGFDCEWAPWCQRSRKFHSCDHENSSPVGARLWRLEGRLATSARFRVGHRGLIMVKTLALASACLSAAGARSCKRGGDV
jgi:hypothetical protein